jgi:hypothetical protein
MYGVLMAYSPGCVAFSLPVQRWNLIFLSFQRFPLSSKRLCDPRGRKEEWFETRAAVLRLFVPGLV